MLGKICKMRHQGVSKGVGVVSVKEIARELKLFEQARVNHPLPSYNLCVKRGNGCKNYSVPKEARYFITKGASYVLVVVTDKPRLDFSCGKFIVYFVAEIDNLLFLQGKRPSSREMMNKVSVIGNL